MRWDDVWGEALPHACPIPALASRSLNALWKSPLANGEPLLSTRRYLLPIICLQQPSPCPPQPDGAALLLPAAPQLGLGLHPHHLGAHQQPQKPILTYTLDGCTGEAQNWWEQNCSISREVARVYGRRVDIQPNGALALRDVQDEDAGTYLVTVRDPEGLACVAVNLSVSRGN